MKNSSDDSFELAREPAIQPLPVRFTNVKTRQTKLLSGLDLLPGQLDLFATDGERDETTWPRGAAEGNG